MWGAACGLRCWVGLHLPRHLAGVACLVRRARLSCLFACRAELQIIAAVRSPLTLYDGCACVVWLWSRAHGLGEQRVSYPAPPHLELWALCGRSLSCPLYSPTPLASLLSLSHPCAVLNSSPSACAWSRFGTAARRRWRAIYFRPRPRAARASPCAASLGPCCLLGLRLMAVGHRGH